MKRRINVSLHDLPVVEEHPSDFRNTQSWRVLRILGEFISGFNFLADYNDVQTISVFGSTQPKEGEHWYDLAHELGTSLAKAGYGVVTGGGPGIMEAANRGAFEAEGHSIGFTIQLPFEERVNPYVTDSMPFHYFFSRKVMLSFAAQAYIYFPGGFGTINEFFEIAELIYTKKISQRVPVILVGSEYWKPLVEWLEKDTGARLRYITEDGLLIYRVVDTVDEIMDIVKKTVHVKYF